MNISASLILLQATVIMCTIMSINAWPKVGEKANSDIDCVRTTNITSCNLEYKPVCAKFFGIYIQGGNLCEFCKRFGRIPALILQIGTEPDRDFSCRELRAGDFVFQDPECPFWYQNTNCSRQLRPYCGTLDNFQTYEEGANKCLFCSQFGNTNARIVNIGISPAARCAPFQIGTRANGDLGCRYLASRADKSCTLELAPVCATLSNGTPVQETNKCFFCTRYGNTNAVIRSC